MDMKQAIGQRLTFGFKGTAITREFAALVREYRIGNVILFKYNVESAAQLRGLCADIQALVTDATGSPAFITIDQEGGMVTRLPSDAVVTPGNMAIAATGDPRNAYVAAQITARQLKGLGVNFNLAPDLDVNSDPHNPVIGVRSFGDDAREVAEYGAQSVRGYMDGGVLCCGKHFPGHGDTAVDSHLGLPCIDKSLKELQQTELVPFAAAIKAGVPALMSSHILFPQIEPDSVPATMSRRIMTDLLRTELGFDGLILSDCMVMDAIQKHYGTPSGVLAAMNAGVDIVFVCSNEGLQRASVEELMRAAEAGELNANAMEDSLRRVREAKRRYAFTESTDGLASRQEDFAQAAELARRAITRMGGEGFTADENTFFCGCADNRVTQAANADPDAVPFAEAMRRKFGGGGFVCDTDPSEEQIAAVVEASRGFSKVVMSTCNARAFKGQLALAEAVAGTGRPLAIVALRSPYDLPLLPRGAYKLCAWDYSRDALSAVAQVLRGGECYGRMPVRLIQREGA